MQRRLVWSMLSAAAPAMVLSSVVLRAQQLEIPPERDIGAISASAVGERIVDGPPSHYSVKRHLHPTSWVDAGVSPLLRLIEGAVPVDILNGPPPAKPGPRIAGVRFGVDSQGSSSGIGPIVTPFHDNLFGTGARIAVPLAVTYKFYESFAFRVGYPLVPGTGVDRLEGVLGGWYASRPSENFFGIGNDSSESDEARFRSVSRVAAVALETRLGGRWSGRLEEAYRSVGITQPRHFQSVTDVFQAQDVPGLSEGGGIMMVTSAFIQRDTRAPVVLPVSGGLLRAGVVLTGSLQGGDFSYWRYRGDVQQFVSLSADQRNVLNVRAAVETSAGKGGGIVPFFDLPAIGGYTTLRGFDSRRFTDNSAVTASLGYRYRIWKYIDWGFFVDAGQVGPEIGDFALNSFHTGYGVRLIGRSRSGPAVSMDIAFSDEKRWVFYFEFNPRF